MQSVDSVGGGHSSTAGPEFSAAMQALFYPKRLAIIGATPRAGFANTIHQNIIKGGFEGELIPITPRHAEVLGQPTYPSIDAVPGGVEHVMVVVPSQLVLEQLELCAQSGAKVVNVITSGFGEQSDEEAHERQRAIREFVARSGVRVIGPNCLGVISMPAKMRAKSGNYDGVLPGPVGLVFQSGLLAFSSGIPPKDRGMGFTYIVTSGNEADLEAADFIRYMVEDEQTRVIGCFIEQFRDPDKLIEVAELAAERGKPIVVLKVGRSEKGQRAAQAHTGSLVGSDAVIDAVMRQHGIVRVHNLDELAETLVAFHAEQLPRGGGIVTIFPSGGAAGLVADLAADHGVQMPALAPQTVERLDGLIPEFGTVGNPLDVTGQAWLMPGVMEGVMESLGEDPNLDIVVYGQAFPSMFDTGTPVGEVFKTFRRRYPDKLLFISSLVAGKVKPVARFISDPIEPTMHLHGVPFLQGSENTLKALRSLVWYADYQRNRAVATEPPPADPQRAEQARMLVIAAGSQPMVERAAKELLALYGIPTTQDVLATDLDEALEVAQEIGYPVVLKIESPDIAHKTEAGGVLLGIGDPDALAAGYQQILTNARQYDANAKLNGVLIQELVGFGRELIVGMTHDPGFGPAIAIGLGGIFVELLKDVALGVPPLDEREARAMLDRLRGAAILRGTRGEPPADVPAIVDLVQRFSQLTIDLRGLVSEIDMNPVIVFDEGLGLKVVDCLIVPAERG